MEKILLCGDIDVNCYFIEYNKKCYIIDPGYEKEKIIKYIKSNELQVEGILLTHAHIDHICAIDCFDVPIYIHEKEYEILIDDSKNGLNHFGKQMPYSLEILNVVKINENSTFEIDDRKIEVIHTPGHTVGGVCYKVDSDLYTGDTLFEGAVGKWTFPTGNLETLKRTVVNLIDTQDESIRIHPAHGASSTIGEEKKYNYFYLNWKKELNTCNK